MSKPNPNTRDYWTPARRKAHGQRLEEYYESQLISQPGWAGYIAVTSGRWGRDSRSAQSKRMKQYWAGITPEEKKKRSEAITIGVRVTAMPRRFLSSHRETLRTCQPRPFLRATPRISPYERAWRNCR